MSAKAIYEVDGKRLLAENLPEGCPGKNNIFIAGFGEGDSWEKVQEAHPFLTQKSLVAKPDQLIKRRGKLGLVKVKLDFDAAKAWVNEKMNSSIQIGSATGTLKHFVLEPFVAHEQVRVVSLHGIVLDCVRANKQKKKTVLLDCHFSPLDQLFLSTNPFVSSPPPLFLFPLPPPSSSSSSSSLSPLFLLPLPPFLLFRRMSTTAASMLGVRQTPSCSTTRAAWTSGTWTPRP